ncbi:MAG: GNAT family N-acetyltransferase [Cyclobacteriaceae bacterium]
MSGKDIAIRKMRPSDLPSLMLIKNAENWNQTEEDWLFLMEHFPEYCLVALDEEKVVGTITSTNFKNQVAWIGMMLVSKLYRGKGISKLLMTTMINTLQDCESIKLDATPAGAHVYTKLGFQDEYEIFRMTRAGERNIDEPENSLVREIDVESLDSFFAMDQKVFGTDRSGLLKYLLEQGANVNGCISKNGQVNGFLLTRPGTNFTQLGPIIAESSDASIHLIASALTKLKGPIVVDVLADKTSLIKWLEQIGFKTQRSFTRMFLKGNPYPGQLDRHFAIAGPEFG